MYVHVCYVHVVHATIYPTPTVFAHLFKSYHHTHIFTIAVVSVLELMLGRPVTPTCVCVYTCKIWF